MSAEMTSRIKAAHQALEAMSATARSVYDTETMEAIMSQDGDRARLVVVVEVDKDEASIETMACALGGIASHMRFYFEALAHRGEA